MTEQYITVTRDGDNYTIWEYGTNNMPLYEGTDLFGALLAAKEADPLPIVIVEMVDETDEPLTCVHCGLPLADDGVRVTDIPTGGETCDVGGYHCDGFAVDEAHPGVCGSCLRSIDDHPKEA